MFPETKSPGFFVQSDGEKAVFYGAGSSLFSENGI